MHGVLRSWDGGGTVRTLGGGGGADLTPTFGPAETNVWDYHTKRGVTWSNRFHLQWNAVEIHWEKVSPHPVTVRVSKCQRVLTSR